MQPTPHSDFEQQVKFLKEGEKGQLSWAISYLGRKGIYLEVPSSITALKNQLYSRPYNNGLSESQIKKMGLAWNAYRRRKSNTSSMLNVTISDRHIKKLKDMAAFGRKTKIQIVEELIDDNYKHLKNQKEKELQARMQKKSDKDDVNERIKKATNKLQHEVQSLTRKVNEQHIKISSLQKLIEQMKLNSSMLFEIIEKSKENQANLTERQLIDATMLYVTILNSQSSFSETSLHTSSPKHRSNYSPDPLRSQSS